MLSRRPSAQAIRYGRLPQREPLRDLDAIAAYAPALCLRGTDPAKVEHTDSVSALRPRRSARDRSRAQNGPPRKSVTKARQTCLWLDSKAVQGHRNKVVLTHGENDVHELLRRPALREARPGGITHVRIAMQFIRCNQEIAIYIPQDPASGPALMAWISASVRPHSRPI